MFKIKIASNLDQVLNAWALMYKQYKRYGHVKANPLEIWTYPQNISSRNLTLCGYEENELVATCSAVLDSEQKLPLDHYFPKEINALRAQGKKLMEIGLLADKRENAKISKILDLCATLGGFSLYMGHPDLVIGCDPRSIRYYSTIGFTVIGESKTYDSLEGAAVVLLHQDLSADTKYTKFLIPMINDLVKDLDLESRYRFPQSELKDSLIEKFFNHQESEYDYAR